MPMKNLHQAFIHEMSDLLSAEQQIVNALPKMAKSANNSELRSAFEEHQQQTNQQIERLQRAFTELNESAQDTQCDAMAGIIDEGEELLKEDAEPAVKDALLIAAAQKVEHYEVASYGTVCAWAGRMGHSKVQKLLEETLEEEKATDAKLTKLAQQINPEALPA